jgi:5,10-methylenetetrahydromethanopterin reductase
MTGAETLANYIVPTISAAATAAGRPAPRIGAALPVQITDDVAAARAYANTEFAVYNDLPSYRAMLDREGAAGPGDVALVGTVADVRGQILRLEDGGVTDFVAVEFGTADERARTRELLVSLL